MFSPVAFEPSFAHCVAPPSAPTRWTDTLSMGFVLHLLSRRQLTREEAVSYCMARFGAGRAETEAVVDDVVTADEVIDGEVLLRPLDLDRDEWLDDADSRVDSLAWCRRTVQASGHLRLVPPLP